MIKKVLFWDFDGTIIHPNESFLCALANALKSLQYKADVQAIRKFLRSVCSWYMPEISYEKNTGLMWWESLFKKFDIFYEHTGIDESDRKELNKLFKDYILSPANYVLYDDSKEVLRKCRAMGYKNYILSNNFPELPDIVEKLGLSEYFSDYIISSNVGFEKPRMELFQHAIRIADYPDICYMIGDNPVADIQGGKNAGMKTILVHNTEKNNKADYTCANLLEIPALLK